MQNQIIYHKNTFIYAEQHRRHRCVYHYTFDDPLDTSRVPFPYSYEREGNHDNTVSGLELACCQIITQKQSNVAWEFVLGSFFQLPVSLNTSQYILKSGRSEHLNAEIPNYPLYRRTSSCAKILKVIGVELSKQQYQDQQEAKKAFKEVTPLAGDVNQCILFPYVYDEIANIDEYYPTPEKTTYELPVDWSIEFTYQDNTTKRINRANSYMAYYSFYNDFEYNKIGLYVEPRHIILLDRKRPLKMQLVFHDATLAFFKSEFVEIPDAWLLMTTCETLRSIDWSHDE